MSAKQPSFSAALAIALAVALVLRLAWPLADPPSQMSWSTGAYTDPPSNALAARYEVEAGDGDGAPAQTEGGRASTINVPERLIYPAYHSLARIAYEALGVRRLSTVILAALLGTATIALLALALRPGDHAAISVAVLGATNSWLVPNSRILTAEGVALFFLAIACFLAMLQRRIGWFTAGAMAAAAGFFGKYHALAFLPALLIFLRARNGWKAAEAAFIGGFVVAVAWGAAIFFPHRAEIVEWIRQSSVGAAEDSRQGFLPHRGWLAPFSALKESWMSHRMPIVAVSGAWFVVRTLSSREMFRRRILDGSALFVLWAVLSFFSISLFTYTAPRYFTLVAAPLVVCVACQIASLWTAASNTNPSKPMGAIATFLFSWIAAFIALDALVRLQRVVRTHLYLEDWVRDPSSLPTILKLPEAIHNLERQTTVAFVLAALATAFVLARRRFANKTAAAASAATRVRSLKSSPTSRRLGLTLLIAILTFDLIMWGTWALTRSSTIEFAKASLREILPPNAVIMGSFAPLLTEGSNLIAVPQFGPLEEADLVREPKPTHILLYGADATDLQRSHPILKGRTVPVARWPIRTSWTRDLVLFRLLSPDEPPTYQPSLYERAIEQLMLGAYSEASALAEEYREQHGETLTQIQLAASCRFADEGSPDAEALYRRAIKLNPLDPIPLRNLGWIAMRRGDEKEARALWMKALAIDPSDPELADLVRPLLLKPTTIE